jgi:hypothetical protein
MNLPALLDALEGQGIDNPVVCANINKIAFRMSGGRELYERTIRSRRFRPIAMSVLASGALNVNDAVRYVAGLGTVRSIVFGASSRQNIVATKNAIDTYLGHGADVKAAFGPMIEPRPELAAIMSRPEAPVPMKH